MNDAHSDHRPLPWLLTGAFLQMATYLVGIIFGIVLTPYLLQSLGERHYSIFLIAGIFTNWCGLIDFGMTTTVSRFATYYYSAGDLAGLRRSAATSFVILFVLAAIAIFTGGISALVARLGWSQTPDISLFCAVFLMTGLTFALTKITDGVSGIINGTLHQAITGAGTLILRLATGLTVFLTLYFGGKIIALLTGSFILALINLVVLAVIMRSITPRWDFRRENLSQRHAKELLRYALPTFLNQVGDLLIQRTDLILISALLSLNEMLDYNLAVVVFISYTGSVLQALTLWETNWFTHLFRSGNQESFERSRFFSYKFLTYIMVFISFMLIFWSDQFITRWVGAEYLRGFPSLVFLASLMGLYRGTAETNIRLLQAIASHQFLAVAVLIQGGVTLLLSFVLIRGGMGIFGAAVGMGIPALLTHGVAVPLYLCRLKKESFLLYLGKEVSYLLRAGIALILPWFLLRELNAPNYPALFVSVLVTGTVYLIGISIIGFSTEEKTLIRGFFSSLIQKVRVRRRSS